MELDVAAEKSGVHAGTPWRRPGFSGLGCAAIPVVKTALVKPGSRVRRGPEPPGEPSRCDFHYFEGTIAGQIVMPLGETSFGWDPIFQPDGYDVTFAEMGVHEKNQISMRHQAAQKLADFFSV